MPANLKWPKTTLWPLVLVHVCELSQVVKDKEVDDSIVYCCVYPVSVISKFQASTGALVPACLALSVPPQPHLFINRASRCVVGVVLRAGGTFRPC